MGRFHHETLVAAPLDEVWAAHQDIQRLLAELTPASAKLRVESVHPLPAQLGTRVEVTARALPFWRVRWAAEYVAFNPPADGKAGFVDEQRHGPFAHWRHEHRFESHGKGTRCVDDVHFTPPLGWLGGLLSPLLVDRQLRAMFAHRDAVLIARFGDGNLAGCSA